MNGKAKRKGPRKGLNPLKLFGGRWATRTPGLWFRRPTLYPPELIAHEKIISNSGTLSRRIAPAPGWARGCGAGEPGPISWQGPRRAGGHPGRGAGVCGLGLTGARHKAYVVWGAAARSGQPHNLMATKGPRFTGGVSPWATHKTRSAGSKTVQTAVPALAMAGSARIFCKSMGPRRRSAANSWSRWFRAWL